MHATCCSFVRSEKKKKHKYIPSFSNICGTEDIASDVALH